MDRVTEKEFARLTRDVAQLRERIDRSYGVLRDDMVGVEGTLGQASFIVVGLHADLTAERVFADGWGIQHTDAGANNTFTVAVKQSDLDGRYLTAIPDHTHQAAGQGGKIDHGAALNGLSDDDHTQYVHISTARTITARHTFNPGAANSPFILGANAQGQLVTGLNADQVDGYHLNQGVQTSNSPTFAGLTINGNIIVSGTVDGVDVSAHAARHAAAGGDAVDHDALTNFVANEHIDHSTVTLTAGDGLTGGGTIAASRTFNVGAGTLITVAADSVGITAGANYQFIGTGSGTAAGWRNVSELAGAGLTASAGVLAVGAGDGLTVSADAVALTTPGTLSVSTTNSATGSHTHAITTSSNPTAASILASNASGYLQLVRLGLGVAPGYPLHILGTTEQARMAYDASNYASFTVSSGGILTIAPTGDLVLNPGGSNVLPGSSIEDDLGDYNRKWRTLYAAELYVETLVAQDVMATIGGRIMVAPTTELIADVTTGATTIDVKHNHLSQNDYVMLSSAPGGAAQFEVMQITSAATSITGGYRYSVSRNKDGSGANAWAKGDAIANLGYAAGEGYIELTSTSTTHGDLGPNVTIYTRDGTTNWNDVAPTVAMGNLQSFVDYSVYEAGFAVGNDLDLTPATGFKGMAADRTNGLRLFNVGLRMYDSANLRIEADPTATGTGALLWAGPSSSDKRLVIQSDGDVRLTNCGLSITDGDFTLKTAASGARFELANTGIKAYNASSVQRVQILNDGSGWFGSATAFTWTTAGAVTATGITVRSATSGGRVVLSTSGIEGYSASYQTFALQTDGDFFIGSNLATASTISMVMFANVQTYNSESMGAGDVLLGDNSVNKANMLWDVSDGMLRFRGGTTTQAYIGTTGAIMFGGGDGKLDANGLTFTEAVSSTGNSAAIKWQDGSNEIGRIISYRNSFGYHYMFLWSKDPNGDTISSIKLRAGDISNLAEIYAITNQLTEAAETKKIGFVIDASGPEFYIYQEDEGAVPVTTSQAAVFSKLNVRVERGIFVGGTSTNAPYGYVHVNSGLSINEVNSTPVHTLAESAQADIYLKGDRLIFRFNDASTIRYKYLTLSSTTTTWVHTTTAP